ncbi:MAG: ABC transporter permease [Defluviitaleaceae bacterium]|nr:ABC transporter permease [Defluviitaleaceae bacterium]
MSIIDVMGMCLKNLYKRKLRTFLTLLGVIIGTGSIILMISLGLATNAQFEQMIVDMNLNMTEIEVFPMWAGMMWTDDGVVETAQRDLTDESIENFLRIPGVRTATPMIQAQLMFRSGPYTMLATVVGVRPDALALMGYNLNYGRLLREGDEDFTFVFSERSERGFFDASDRTAFHWDNFRQWDTSDDVITLVDIFNDDIRIYYDDSSYWNTRDWGGGWGFGDDDEFGYDIGEGFETARSFDINIVGVVAAPAVDLRWGGGQTIYTDIETLQALNLMQQESQRRAQEDDDWNPTFSALVGGPRETYQDVRVRTATMDDTSEVAEIIREMGYNVWFPGDWIEQMRDSQRGIETLLFAIAAVSLFVAAINIANTMITSVTERTREIGIMKVIGASLSDIRWLFLFEAAVIGFLGGVFGVMLALLLSFLINIGVIPLAGLGLGAPEWMVGDEAGVTSLVTAWLCLVALGVAVTVGLVSGFFPAFRATRLSALAAIRGD